MLPFDPPENTRKPFLVFWNLFSQTFSGFLMYSEGSKGNIGKKRVKVLHGNLSRANVCYNATAQYIDLDKLISRIFQYINFLGISNSLTVFLSGL